MSEKRRVLVGSSTATTSNNDTPTRHGVPGRASPAIATSARAKVILNNNSHAGLSSTSSPGQAAAASSSGTSTPTARGGLASTPSQASSSVTRANAGPGYAASPSAGSSRLPGQVRARVLGYGGQQHGEAGSPLASSSAGSSSAYRTPPANSGPVTPGSSYTPHAARAQAGAAGTAGSSRLGATTPSSVSSESDRGKHASSSSTAFPAASRKIRAASTPPSHDSPTVNIASASASTSASAAPPPSPRRRAFPAFANSSERSSSPSLAQQPSSNAASRPPLRIRGISARSAQDVSSPAAAAAARLDPAKPKLVHASKSMTSRPAAASPSGLLPSPSIRPSNSTIFPSTSTSSAPMAHSASAPLSHALPSPSLPSTSSATYSQSPTPSMSASTVRPSSPFKPKTRPVSPSHVLRPHANTRPGSPERSSSARPAIQGSPRRPGIAARSATVPAPAPAPPARMAAPTSPIAASKRPSAASQSSSIASTSMSTADVSATTANTSFSPDVMLSDSAGKTSRTSTHSTASTSASTAPTSTTSAAIASHNTNSNSSNGYHHRSRRRSQSTSSSISSLSGFGGGSSSIISKSRPLSMHINGNTTQETAARPRGNSFAAKSTTTATSNKNVGIGINIPLASPAGASLSNMLVSPSSRGAGPYSPGKSVRSESDKAEQAAHQDAKVHRKILDLEITNTSLLAINASLEKAKIKQATEMRDLRRRLRERSLAPLPSNGAVPLLSPLSDGMSPWERDVDFGSAGTNDEDAPEQTWEEMLRQDEKFADLVRLLDGMHRKAREALDRTVKSEEKLLGGRVLNHFSLLHHDMNNNNATSGIKKITGHVAEMSTATSASVSVNGEVEGEDEDEGTAPETSDVSGLSDLKATAAAFAAATPRLGAGIKTRQQREASAETEGDSTEQSSSIEISGVNSTEFSISID